MPKNENKQDNQDIETFLTQNSINYNDKTLQAEDNNFVFNDATQQSLTSLLEQISSITNLTNIFQVQSSDDTIITLQAVISGQLLTRIPLLIKELKETKTNNESSFSFKINEQLKELINNIWSVNDCKNYISIAKNL